MKIERPENDIHISGELYHTSLGHISVRDQLGQGWGMGINLERQNVTPDDLRKLADYLDTLYQQNDIKGHVCKGCGSKGWKANCDQCIPY